MKWTQVCCCSCLCTIADKWRVTLKGETNDYIHASFANVRLIRPTSHLPIHTKVVAYNYKVELEIIYPHTGLQTVEEVHYHPGSDELHLSRLLEDGL